jgi:oxaloacetate decarboxylase alpha subunit
MLTSHMLPIAEKSDKAGFWSLETGRRNLRFLHPFSERDPWERIRKLKAAMPNTPQQMLLRGQTILGYRNYAGRCGRKMCRGAWRSMALTSSACSMR